MCISIGRLNEIWPDCKLLRCSVHFQRAISRLCRKCGIYSNKDIVYDKHLPQDYGLCFVPETIHHSSIHHPLSIIWMRKQFHRHRQNKNISVADVDVRVNNGSEAFHFSIQRMHSWMRNNILDFLAFVRKVTLNQHLNSRNGSPYKHRKNRNEWKNDRAAKSNKSLIDRMKCLCDVFIRRMSNTIRIGASYAV